MITRHIGQKDALRHKKTCTGGKKVVILQPQSGNGRAQK